MDKTPIVYWDACIWIALINQEAGRYERVADVLDRARDGELQIATSTFTLAEVVKRKCGPNVVSMAEEHDDLFAELLTEEFVILVTADWDITTRARGLYREFSDRGLRKPQDALHLATAVVENVDEMHTFDGSDLLILNGLVRREDGMKLTICHPPEARVKHPSLFDGVEDEN